MDNPVAVNVRTKPLETRKGPTLLDMVNGMILMETGRLSAQKHYKSCLRRPREMYDGIGSTLV